MVKGFKKKNSKGGHDFIPTDKGVTRDISNTPDTNVNIEIDNNSDDFAEGVKIAFERDLKHKTELIEKRDGLMLALDDADRRFNIAINRIHDITNRLHELEILRNLALRKEFLAEEIENNPEIPKTLIKEFNGINADSRDIFTYEEVAKGYRSMSRRKNELEEERNQYVKEIEELDSDIARINDALDQ